MSPSIWMPSSGVTSMDAAPARSGAAGGVAVMGGSLTAEDTPTEVGPPQTPNSKPQTPNPKLQPPPLLLPLLRDDRYVPAAFQHRELDLVHPLQAVQLAGHLEHRLDVDPL